MKTVRLLAAILAGVPLVAQAPAIKYPQPHTANAADDYFGTKVADPYRWMEDLSSPELKKWIDQENAVTSKYLDALPVRDALKNRISTLWDYPKVGFPRFEGRRWYYTRNSGLQRQAVVFSRETLSGAETVVIDPNQLSPDGSIALSNWEPSPDGRHVTYGQSPGGSDWSTYYVRDLSNGRQLDDVVRWVKFSAVAWAHTGRGFFYGRYPEPPEGKALEAALADKKVYYHALGTP